MRLLVSVLAAVLLPMSVGFSQVTFLVPSQVATISLALSMAQSGDTIEVAPGTYNEFELQFAGKAVTLRGTNGPELTIIDAAQQGRVVVFQFGEGNDTVLEGFTITGGRSLDGASTGTGAGEIGGGIYVVASSPTIRDCIISGNRAGDGGSGGLANGSPGGLGGGVAVLGGDPIIDACVIRENCAGDGGDGGFSSSPLGGGTGAPGGSGGGVSFFLSSATLTNCIIAENVGGAGGAGGPGSIGGGGAGGSGGNGGGVWDGSGTVTVLNCTILLNASGIGGAGFGTGAAGADGTGSGVWGAALVRNSIVRTNTLDDVAATASVVHSNVTGLGGGPGMNIDFPSFFVDPANDDYHLQNVSPCVDAGDPSTIGLPTTDIDGDPRAFGVPDIGADEFVNVAIYPGSGLDFVQEVEINNGGAPRAGIKLATPGDLLTLRYHSPQGAFNFFPAAVVAQVFGTGSPPVGPAPFTGELYIDPFGNSAPVLIYGESTTLGPAIVAPNGTMLQFIVSPFLSGFSVMVQSLALTFGPPAANGFFAASDGTEIQVTP